MQWILHVFKEEGEQPMIDVKLLERLKPVTEEEQRILDGETVDRSLYMTEDNDVIHGKKMLADGKQIAVRPHTRFVHFPSHSHDYVEIVYMCSGSTTHIVSGETIRLLEGELLFLSQGTVHEVLAAEYNDIALNFIVRPSFFDGVLQMIGEEDTPIRSFLLDCIQNRRNAAGYLKFDISGILPMENLMENLIWTLVNQTPNRRNMNQITMGLLFLHLINHADKLRTHDSEEQLTVAILNYIEENYKTATLAELAEILHYDISTLSRKIKTVTGKSYIRLVHEKRLSQAHYLLKTTKIKVEDVAEMIGYKNVSYFYRIFKEKYGVSPKKCKTQ